MFVPTLIALVLVGTLLSIASAIEAVWLNRPHYKRRGVSAPPLGWRRTRETPTRAILDVATDPAGSTNVPAEH